MLPRSARVCAAGLARLLTGKHIGALHPVLERASGADVDDAVAARGDDERARTAFQAHGWLDADARLYPEVSASLAVLCRPWVEFYGWINDGEHTYGVLAAAIGGEALLAVREADSVLLSHIRPRGLAEALVSQTPDVPPARHRSVEVLQSEALAGVGGRSTPEVELVHRIAAQPVTGSGELHVAVRDGLGRRHPARHPLRYVDTPDGRWLNHTTPAPGGDKRILVAPATRGDLAVRLQEIYDSVRI